jgi:hypothetical protein
MITVSLPAHVAHAILFLRQRPEEDRFFADQLESIYDRRAWVEECERDFGRPNGYKLRPVGGRE